MPSLSRRVQVLFFVASGLVATGYVLVIYSTLRHSHDQVSLVERDAQSYLASLYETPPRFSCGHADTNGDGYISCTAVLDSGAPLAFECSPFFAQCRLTEPRFFSPTP